MPDKSQAILNAKAHAAQKSVDNIKAIIAISRIHLFVCSLFFVTFAVQGKISETWALGLPVTLLGAPALANGKKMEERAFASIKS